MMQFATGTYEFDRTLLYGYRKLFIDVLESNFLPCSFHGLSAIDPDFDLNRHDAVCELLRENGAALNMAGKVAGILMCQVQSNYSFNQNSALMCLSAGCICWIVARGHAAYCKRSFCQYHRFRGKNSTGKLFHLYWLA